MRLVNHVLRPSAAVLLEPQDRVINVPLALDVSISVNHPHMLSANSGLCVKPLAARSTVRVRTARSLRLVSGTSRWSSKNALISF